MTAPAHGQRLDQRLSPRDTILRLAHAARDAWPSGAPGRVLLALVILGALLRVSVIVSWWPTTILQDGYQLYAQTGPFRDPLHPAGYELILGALGILKHAIAVPMLLQPICGIASALLLGAATRRITRSAWAGLLAAGIVLLDGDVIFLEHSIMSESWEILATSIGLYGAVRTLDQPEPWWRWPALTGAALGIAVTIRSAALPMLAVTCLALLVGRPGVLKSWRSHWRAPAAAAGIAAIILLGFAGVNARYGYRFGIAPSPGWYLYGDVAQFADCNRFTPPTGTAALCQTTPMTQRQGPLYYMYSPGAPATRLFGAFGRNDGLIGTWAQRALRAQFGGFLSSAWRYLRGFYVPSSLPARLRSGLGLDPQLDFTNKGIAYTNKGKFDYAPSVLSDLEAYYGRFTVHRFEWGLQRLRDWQLVFRFGATALFITTILASIGLVIGSRRSRVGVLLFGVGGLSLLLTPALSGLYLGRFTVPTAGPLMAAAAITVTEICRALGTAKSKAARGAGGTGGR